MCAAGRGGHRMSFAEDGLENLATATYLMLYRNFEFSSAQTCLFVSRNDQRSLLQTPAKSEHSLVSGQTKEPGNGSHGVPRVDAGPTAASFTMSACSHKFSNHIPVVYIFTPVFGVYETASVLATPVTFSPPPPPLLFSSSSSFRPTPQRFGCLSHQCQ